MHIIKQQEILGFKAKLILATLVLTICVKSMWLFRKAVWMGEHVSRLYSVWLIACSNLNQLLPLLMHVGKWLVAMMAVKSSAGAAPEMYLRECTSYLPQQTQIRQSPLCLWNPEETSPEIPNGVSSSPEIGRMNVSNKKSQLTSTSTTKIYYLRFASRCLQLVDWWRRERLWGNGLGDGTGDGTTCHPGSTLIPGTC